MESHYFSEEECSWQHPKTIIISGASSTGKSTLIFEIIRNRDRVLRSENKLPVRYHLPESHKIDVAEDLRQDSLLKFYEGLPNFDSIHEQCIIVLDDMASLIDQSVLQGFLRHSHHKKVSILLVVHNIYHSENKNIYRTISLNTNIFFILKNVRDTVQIRTLAQQIDPFKSKAILEAYKDAVSRRWGYFVIDFSPTTNDRLRFRTNIFDSDPSPRNVIYLV